MAIRLPRYLQLAVPEDHTAWLESALQATPTPQTLKERNIYQIMLAERLCRQFGYDRLTALQHVAGPFAEKFPH